MSLTVIPRDRMFKRSLFGKALGLTICLINMFFFCLGILYIGAVRIGIFYMPAKKIKER